MQLGQRNAAGYAEEVAHIPWRILDERTQTASDGVQVADLGINPQRHIIAGHAGVEARIFEGFTTCTATTGLSLQDIMKVPLVRCDQIQWSFLGISMAGWNAILSLGGAALITLLALKDRRA